MKYCLKESKVGKKKRREGVREEERKDFTWLIMGQEES